MSKRRTSAEHSAYTGHPWHLFDRSNYSESWSVIDAGWLELEFRLDLLSVLFVITLLDDVGLSLFAQSWQSFSLSLNESLFSILATWTLSFFKSLTIRLSVMVINEMNTILTSSKMEARGCQWESPGYLESMQRRERSNSFVWWLIQSRSRGEEADPSQSCISKWRASERSHFRLLRRSRHRQRFLVLYVKMKMILRF